MNAEINITDSHWTFNGTRSKDCEQTVRNIIGRFIVLFAQHQAKPTYSFKGNPEATKAKYNHKFNS